ncbi:MAG: glycosyltransferase family 4 protein [Candidatus Acidiferrales bacterium]
MACELIGWNDPRGKGSFTVGAQQYEFTGCDRNKIVLFLKLLWLAPRIEILFFSHLNLSPIGYLLNFVRPGLRYCVVGHGVEAWEPLPAYRRLGVQHAERVLAVSAYTKNAMVKLYKLDPQRVYVIFNALDPSFTQVTRDPISVPDLPSGRMILTVARLNSAEPGKGMDAVIKVLAQVMKAVPDVFYVVVGEGDLRPRLEELAREHSVEDRVIFTGEVQFDRLRGYYARTDVFAMPSRQEGFGIVFAEAGLFGKPAIAGDQGGAPEVVQDGVTGFSVDPDDLEALTSLLIKLLQDEPLRARMGAAGRRRVQENFTFEPFQARLTRILDTMAGDAS